MKLKFISEPKSCIDKNDEGSWCPREGVDSPGSSWNVDTVTGASKKSHTSSYIRN